MDIDFAVFFLLSLEQRDTVVAKSVRGVLRVIAIFEVSPCQ
ncbi:MAG: hypothetical protein VCC01_05410 [Candidatus Hydrogenedentota bacterium]